MIPATQPSEPSGIWHKLAALILVVAALGLPVNDLYHYALLVVAAVVILVGQISSRPIIWLTAAVIAALGVIGQTLMSAPRIEEGHNVFLGGEQARALAIGLPADAYRQMTEEFDRAYPFERRCDPATPGCWRGHSGPERPYAFSADGIFDLPLYSRRVTGIDFSDPVWLRLGFINEVDYNWYADTSDLQRNVRERSLLNVFHPWRLTMPYFVMYRFPAAYVGSELCWQGLVLWEQADEKFLALRHDAIACRTLTAGDIGRRIFGVSIARDATLAMQLRPPVTLSLRNLAASIGAALAVAAVLLLLVRWQTRRVALSFLLIALSLVVVLFNDASFIGGLRPFDGGDDGLFYDGVGRNILQHVLRGEFMLALEGGEKVYYYGGPGLRYFRAAEHLIFGETYFGYLSLMLALPFVVMAAFRRFLSARAALAMTLVFIAIPLGALFGTTLFQYVKWAARGFADPAAAALFMGGLVVLVGRARTGPDARFAPAFGAGLLFALALFVRPNLAPGAAVLLGGAGLAALWQTQWRRLSGLCIGFLPVFGMALHNWVFGGVFVLFSANAAIPEAIPMPPSDYLPAIGELLRMDFAGDHLRRGALQLARWLAGPSESFVMIPLHAAAIVVLLRVGLARRYDPWLRLIAWSALALHPVAWFYLSYDRYYYLTWLLTLLICAVWMRDEAWPWLRVRNPAIALSVERGPVCARFTRWFDRLLAS